MSALFWERIQDLESRDGRSYLCVTVAKFLYLPGNNITEENMNHLDSKVVRFQFRTLKEVLCLFTSCSLCWITGFLLCSYNEQCNLL